MYLGIDVGGTKIQGAYLLGEAVLLSDRIATPANYEDFLATLSQLIEEAQERSGPISKIGIGVPGTASLERVTWVPNLSYLDGKELANDLRKLVGVEAVISNDAQLALLGEQWRGAAQGAQNAALISVGTGVGGALLLDGRIIRGAHGSAGSFGWLNLDWRAVSNSDHGYLEMHAAGIALEATGQHLNPPISSYEIIARARTGEPVAYGIVEHFSKLLGLALASLASVIDPEILIFSGGLSEAFDLLSPGIHACIREYGSPSVRETPVVAGQLGTYAAAYGALRTAMFMPFEE